MKINANVLNDFLESVSIKGAIMTAVLNFSAEGLKVAVQSANLVFTTGTLDKEAFLEYEALGEVGIKNMIVFNKILKRYEKSVIRISKEENKIKVVSESGSTFYVICDAENVDNHVTKLPSILEKLPLTLELDVNGLQNIKKAAEVLNVNDTTLEVKDGVVILSVENEVGDKITEEIKVTGAPADCKAKYSDFLQKIIDTLKGKVKVGLMTNAPILLVEQRDKQLVKYLVAPLVDVEVSKEESKAEEPKAEEPKTPAPKAEAPAPAPAAEDKKIAEAIKNPTADLEKAATVPVAAPVAPVETPKTELGEHKCL